MSGIPYKLDGLDGDNEVRAKFTSFYASEALVKGDAVAIDCATSTNGLGKHVLKANSGEANNAQVVGVATETIASGDVGVVQIAGVCTFAKLLDTDDAVGNLVGSSGTDGSMTLMAADTILPAAIILVEGTANTADSTVFLLNSHNL